MQAKLLTDDHFREIAQLRNVAEVVTYLKKLPAYAKAFETVDENMSRRSSSSPFTTITPNCIVSRVWNTNDF